MMRERSRANFVSPEKTNQQYRVPVSGYLPHPQNSNPSRLGEGARDFSKLLIRQLLIILCQNEDPDTVRWATILWAARLLSLACILPVIFAHTTRDLRH